MKKLILLLSCLVFLVAGCGKEADDGSLKVMLGSNVVSLDSAKVTDVSSLELIADCIDGLMQLDEKDEAVPAVAESFEVSEDGKTYTFHLRDVKWSNGDPVTANDFVFAWRRECKIADEYAYMFGSTVACIKNADDVIGGADPELLGVYAEDEKTLRVELDAPVPYFPSLMAYPVFFPINEKFFATLGDGTYGTSPETFLSNGAFLLKEYTPGAASIRLVKNAAYWDSSAAVPDTLTYQVVGSSDNALTAFKNGTLNVVQISGNQVEHVKKDPALAKNLRFVTTGALDYLSFNQDPKNHHAGALANKNMRLAIANAVDRESLTENFIMNGSMPTYTAIPMNFAPNAETGEFFSADQKKYADVVGFNPDRAKEYWEKAKAELGKDSVTFNFIFSNDVGDTVTKTVQAIKSQIEDNLPGVNIKLQPMPKAEYLSNVTSNNYDLAVSNWVPDYGDPMTYFTLWTTEGSKIAEHWSDPEYDAIIAACTSGDFAADYDMRWQAMYDAEKILLDNAVISPLYTNVSAYLIADNVKGIRFHVGGVGRDFKTASAK